jgi:hypothetical protein
LENLNFEFVSDFVLRIFNLWFIEEHAPNGSAGGLSPIRKKFEDFFSSKDGYLKGKIMGGWTLRFLKWTGPLGNVP